MEQLHEDQSLNRQIDEVLTPELGPQKEFSAGDFTVTYRPLPIKQTKILKKHLEPIQNLGNEATVSDSMDVIVEAYLTVAANLCSYYGKEGYSKDKLEETLTFDELRDFIQGQLNVQGEHDFLLGPLRGLFVITDVMTKTMVTAGVTVNSPTSPSGLALPSPSTVASAM